MSALAAAGRRIRKLPRGRNIPRGRGLLGVPALALLIGLFLIPIVRLVHQSLRAPDGTWPSLGAYRDLFASGTFLPVFGYTLALGAGVTAICLLLGVPLGWAYARGRPRTRAIILFAVAAPLLINMVVRAYGWTVLLGPDGLLPALGRALGWDNPPQLLYHLPAVVIGMVHVFLPFMVLTLVPAITSIDHRLYEAGELLGAAPGRLHRTVTLPLLVPGIRNGCILVFALTQGAFVTPLVLGGANVELTATYVYTSALVLYDLPAATAMAVLLLAFVIVLVVGQFAFGRARWERS